VRVSAVDWLVSQPWPVFLGIFLPCLLVILAVLLVLVAGWPPRRPPEPEVSDWHMHTDDCPGRSKCICVGDTIYPCRAHAGQAAAALHQEAP
jgi:hypothetical protein